MKILIATKNPGKAFEINEILHNMGVELITLSDLGVDDEVEEHGDTHEKNAFLKAQYFFEKTGLPTLGEDSGVYVDAFPGELGVKTRRFRDMHAATDEEWIEHFMAEMDGVPDSRRTARFVSVACFVDAVDVSAEVDAAYGGNGTGGEPRYFRGECPGFITHKLEAPLKAGIPLSSCFRPEGLDKVYSALTPEEKSQIGHRGRAMVQFRKFLEDRERGLAS
jgi:XTP/dITP diphosphohydrolase